MLFNVETPRPQAHDVDIDELVVRAFDLIKNWSGRKQLSDCSDESLQDDLRQAFSDRSFLLIGNGFDFGQKMSKHGWPVDTELCEFGDILLGPELSDIRTRLVEKWVDDTNFNEQFRDLNGKRVSFELRRGNVKSEGVVKSGDSMTMVYYIHTDDQAPEASYIVPAEKIVEVIDG